MSKILPPVYNPISWFRRIWMLWAGRKWAWLLYRIIGPKTNVLIVFYSPCFQSGCKSTAPMFNVQDLRENNSNFFSSSLPIQPHSSAGPQRYIHHFHSCNTFRKYFKLSFMCFCRSKRHHFDLLLSGRRMHWSPIITEEENKKVFGLVENDPCL